MLGLKKRKKGSDNRRCVLHLRCYRFGSSDIINGEGERFTAPGR